MRSGRISRRLGGALLAGLLAGAAASLPAAADPSAGRDAIYAQLGVDQVVADYVILVDTSASMTAENRYGAVRSTLLPFLRGLSGTDRVALYTFDSLPRLRFQGDAHNPAAVVAALPFGPNLDGSTDIGAALDSALKRLEQADSADVATVVLVTDGAQDAPATSGYRQVGSPAWTALAQRAGSLGGKTVNAYALPIGTADGARLLSQVFPQANVLDAGAVQDVGPYLDQAKEATRRSKAASKLADDIGHGVTVRWEIPSRLDFTHGSPTVRAVLQSTTARVPLTVSGLAVRSSNPTVAGRAATEAVSLAPGATADIDVRLSWEPDAGLLPVRRTQRKAVDLTLTGTVGSPWAAVLDPVVPLRIPEALPGSPAGVTATAETGLSWVLPVAIAVAALIVLLLCLAAYRRRRPYMPGALSISAVGADRELAHIPLNRRRPLELGGSGLPGSGRVRGRRAPGGTVEVSYTPDGSEQRRVSTLLRPREPLILSGLTFVHQTGDQPGRGR
jgi:VWA domain-containing protein